MIYVLSGGGAGGTLEVTAPAGVTVTATKDGKIKTRIANAQGVAVFKGLSSGTWQLSISDGSQTSTPVSIVIDADYSVTLAFFSATINITYPAGAICTATDGTTTFTAPDTGGTWALTVPNAGMWTIACSTAATGQSKSANVVISSEGQSESVTLAYTLTLLSGTDQHADVTGGWIGDNVAYATNTYPYVVPTISFVADTGASFTVGSPTDRKAGCMRTKNKIDLTNFSTITWTNHGINEYYYVAVVQTIPASGKVTAIASAECPGPLDISALSGEYYILVSTTYGTNVQINNIVLS